VFFVTPQSTKVIRRRGASRRLLGGKKKRGGRLIKPWKLPDEKQISGMCPKGGRGVHGVPGEEIEKNKKTDR